MTIKFNKSEEFVKAKTLLVNALTEGDADKQKEAFEGYLESLRNDVKSEIMAQANNSMMDRSILQNRGQNVLTSAEHKFFQAAIDKKGFDDDALLPVTTEERIFEDLVNEHLLLKVIGLRNMGAVTRMIYSDPEGAAVWGKLFGGIQGQIGASFREEEVSQLKLTAFAVLPNDMLELGPEWTERYIRTIAVEVISVGLEKAYVIGTGKDEPIGLIKDLDGSVTNGVYPDKASAGKLTFEPGRQSILEMKNVVKNLSTNAKGKARKVAGKIIMVVNPFDNFDIQASATVQNASGAYVTNLPFNPQIVESEFVPEGKVIFFVQGQYLAAVAGGYKLKKYDQTLAMEDATLYTIKQFANGKPLDNNASAVYDLDIADGVSGPEGA